MRMYKPLVVALIAAATALAVVGPAGAATSGGTTTTFTVNAGALGITVPGTADLGNGSPGANIIAQLGVVQVTDNRALLAAAWTATVTTSTFTTGDGTGNQTVPIADVSYWSGGSTATVGAGTFTPGQAAVANVVVLSSSRTAFALTGGTGDNSASWNPTVIVAVPAGAVGGLYTGTITHAVA
jgi:hypothetical protein